MRITETWTRDCKLFIAQQIASADVGIWKHGQIDTNLQELFGWEKDQCKE